MKKGERYLVSGNVATILDVVRVLVLGAVKDIVLYHYNNSGDVYCRPVAETVNWEPIKGRPHFQVGQVWETPTGRRVKIIAVDDVSGERCIAYKYPDTGARMMRRAADTEGWVFVP